MKSAKNTSSEFDMVEALGPKVGGSKTRKKRKQKRNKTKRKRRRGKKTRRK